MLGRSEGACRQLASGARRQIGDCRRRFDTDRQQGHQLAGRFVTACAGGDLNDLLGLLTADVVVWTDGGGKAKAAPRPVGTSRAARFLINIAKSIPSDGAVRHASINGQPGVIVEEEGVPITAVVFDVVDGVVSGARIITIRTSSKR